MSLTSISILSSLKTNTSSDPTAYRDSAKGQTTDLFGTRQWLLKMRFLKTWCLHKYLYLFKMFSGAWIHNDRPQVDISLSVWKILYILPHFNLFNRCCFFVLFFFCVCLRSLYFWNVYLLLVDLWESPITDSINKMFKYSYVVFNFWKILNDVRTLGSVSLCSRNVPRAHVRSGCRGPAILSLFFI